MMEGIFEKEMQGQVVFSVVLLRSSFMIFVRVCISFVYVSP